MVRNGRGFFWYQKYIDQLLAEGKAYYSYKTPEELEADHAKQEICISWSSTTTAKL